MTTTAKVKKWGGSMAVLIPGSFARKRRIGVGDVIDLEPVRVVKPQRRRYRLSELMAEFKPKHKHSEWDLGGPVGREVW